MGNKGQLFFKSIGRILSALYKLLLLCCYTIAKTTEALAGMLVKIMDKLIK